MRPSQIAARVWLVTVPALIIGLLANLMWLGVSAIDKTKALEAAPPEWRPIAAPAPDVRCWQYGYSLTIVCLEEP